MAEVKVKVVKAFRDRTADMVLRKEDEVLTVSEERAKLLSDLGFVELETTVESEAVEVSEEGAEKQQEVPKKRNSKQKQ